jgi:VWFA-related protein
MPSGRRRENLTKNDFQLFDEPKPQVITTFTVEKAAERARPVRQNAATVSAATTSAQLAPDDESNVAYVFDDLHTPVDDMQSVKSAAEGQMSAMRPGDRTAVYTTSGEVAVDFTQNRDQLQAALKKLRSEGRPDAGDCPPMTYYEASQILSDADRSATEMAIRDALDWVFQGARSRDQAVPPSEAEKAREVALAKAFEVVAAGNVASDRALQMLAGVISRTAALSGRRTIVLVSPGFLTVAPGSRGKATALIELALQSGIVVNTLDASGLTTTGVQANRTHFNSSMETHGLASQEIAARSEIMADLAYGTGGVFFHNNNDLRDGFRRSTEVPEYIYVLGFPPQKLDGKFHKLKVKVSSDKVTVQARPGYYALKQASGS